MTTAKKTAAAPAKKTAASAAKSDAAKTDETTTTPASAEGTTDDKASADAAPLDAPTGDETTPDQGDGSSDTSTGAFSPAVERGPMTGTPVGPETSARPPATIVNESPNASPLDPPADSHLQKAPFNGIPSSSTDQTYAEVGGQTIAGENHVSLVNREGEPVDIDDLFTDPGGRFTHVVAKERVYELFLYPGTRTPEKRLIFPKGAHVPRAQAAKIQAAAHTDAAQAQV